MPAGDYLEGVVLWAAVAGCAAGTSALLLRGRAVALEGVPRLLAWALLFIAAILAVHLVPGILGILARGSVIACAVVLLALAWATRERAPGARPGGPVLERLRSDRLGWAVAGAAVAVVAWLALAALIERAPVPVTNLDALNFHLPGIAAWIQDGSFWHVRQWVPDLAHGNYPHNGDLLDLSVVLPWRNDAFVRLTGFPLLAMTGLAVYAIGAELGAGRAAAAAWAAAFASMPAVIQPATLEVLTDDVLLATLGTGLLFLLRHVRTGARSDLALAGIGLGVAFGTKWYGVSSVVVILGAWLVAGLIARTPPRIVVRRLAALSGLIAAAGGFWFVRNWVESGNPLFPVKVEVFGQTIFDAPFDRVRAEVGFTVASYLDDPGVLADHILPALGRTVALPGALLGLAALAALVAGLRDRRRVGADPRVPALAVAALGLAVAYAVTPYSALGLEGEPAFTEFNVRYLAPALLAAAPLAAWLSSGAGWLGRAGPILALVATAQAARLTAEEIGTTPLLQSATLLAVAAAAALAWRAARRRGFPGARAPAAVAALGLLAGLAVAGGYELQSRFNDSRYVEADPAFAWAAGESVAGSRIGLVGVWGVGRESPVWPLFGPRLENDVVYVGPFREELLRDYPARRGFTAALPSFRLDYLLVARGEPPRPTVRQLRWARSAGLDPVLRSERFSLLSVPPSLWSGPGR